MNTVVPAMKTRHLTFVRYLEYRLISVVMGVIAYLLERAVLRSIKRSPPTKS